MALSKFAADRARAYSALFDKFIQDRKLEHDDNTWSSQDKIDFYNLAEAQDAEWDAKRAQHG